MTIFVYAYVKCIDVIVLPCGTMLVKRKHTILRYNESLAGRDQLHPSSTNVNAEMQLQSRRKAAKMLIAVVIMFGICYLPVHLLNILR